MNRLLRYVTPRSLAGKRRARHTAYALGICTTVLAACSAMALVLLRITGY